MIEPIQPNLGMIELVWQVNQIAGWKTRIQPIFFTPKTSSVGPRHRNKPRLAVNLVHPRDKHVGVYGL